MAGLAVLWELHPNICQYPLINYLTNYKDYELEEDKDDDPPKNKGKSTVAPGCSKTKDKKIKSPIVESEAELEIRKVLNKTGIVLGPGISLKKSQPGIGQRLLNRRTDHTSIIIWHSLSL